MCWVWMNISSIYYFTEITIILKQHIQSDWIINEPKKNGEMFLESPVRLDIPSSDGRLLVQTNPQHDASRDG